MQEIIAPHTGLLRLGLAVPQSVIYWRRADRPLEVGELREKAILEAWFENLSESRVKYLVNQLEKRFPFEVRALLGFQERPDENQNRLICHWSLQLTDPLYRSYTCEHLLERWSNPDSSVSLASSIRWVKKEPITADWSQATVRRLAAGLLSAATEAGLCSGAGKGERNLKLPVVTPEDIHYLESLLRLAGAQEHLHTYLTAVGRGTEDDGVRP
jgi:hypothetical protein